MCYKEMIWCELQITILRAKNNGQGNQQHTKQDFNGLRETLCTIITMESAQSF